MVRQVLGALERSGVLGQAGDIYQRIGQPELALQTYRRGHHYAKAIELARTVYPGGKTNAMLFPIDGNSLPISLEQKGGFKKASENI